MLLRICLAHGSSSSFNREGCIFTISIFSILCLLLIIIVEEARAALEEKEKFKIKVLNPETKVTGTFVSDLKELRTLITAQFKDSSTLLEEAKQNKGNELIAWSYRKESVKGSKQEKKVLVGFAKLHLQAYSCPMRGMPVAHRLHSFVIFDAELAEEIGRSLIEEIKYIREDSERNIYVLVEKGAHDALGAMFRYGLHLAGVKLADGQEYTAIPTYATGGWGEELKKTHSGDGQDELTSLKSFWLLPPAYEPGIGDEEAGSVLYHLGRWPVPVAIGTLCERRLANSEGDCQQKDDVRDYFIRLQGNDKEEITATNKFFADNFDIPQYRLVDTESEVFLLFYQGDGNQRVAALSVGYDFASQVLALLRDLSPEQRAAVHKKFDKHVYVEGLATLKGERKRGAGKVLTDYYFNRLIETHQKMQLLGSFMSVGTLPVKVIREYLGAGYRICARFITASANDDDDDEDDDEVEIKPSIDMAASIDFVDNTTRDAMEKEICAKKNLNDKEHFDLILHKTGFGKENTCAIHADKAQAGKTKTTLPFVRGMRSRATKNSGSCDTFRE